MLLLLTLLIVPLAVSSSPQITHPGFYNCNNKNPCTSLLGKSAGLLPYEGDGTKYVECSGVRCFERNCSHGTTFNWSEKRCGTDESMPRPSQAPEQRGVACEMKKLVLSCPDKRVLKIKWAMYGRRSNEVCPHKTAKGTIDCSGEAYKKVSEVCDHAQKCKISVHNKFFEGDPCEGIYKYLEATYECAEPDPCADLNHREKKFIDCQEDSIPFPPTRRNANLCPSTKEWVSCTLPLVGSCPQMIVFFLWIAKPLLDKIVPICGHEVKVPQELLKIPIEDLGCAYENVCYLGYYIELKAAGLDGLSSLDIFTQNDTICSLRSKIDFGEWFECAARASYKCGRPHMVAGILRRLLGMSTSDSVMMISSIVEYILKALSAWSDHWIDAASWNVLLSHVCRPECKQVIPTVIRSFPECLWIKATGCSDLRAVENCMMNHVGKCQLVPILIRYISENMLGLPSCEKGKSPT